MFEYGNGKQIEYNITHIKKGAIELLLQGKSKIELNTKVNFQFINFGNLQSQFEDLHKKIPQEPNPEFPNIFEKNQSNDYLHQLLGQLQTTMNFIINSNFTEIQKTVTISYIMDSLKIKKQEKDDIIQPDFMLTHIIQLYEEVEEKVQHIEVEATNKRYKENVSVKEMDIRMQKLS